MKQAKHKKENKGGGGKGGRWAKISMIEDSRASGFARGDPCPSKQLRTAVPSLDAARTALAASTAKLAERVSSIGSCKGSSTSFAAQRGQAARLPTGPAALLEVDTEAAETAVADKVGVVYDTMWRYAEQQRVLN